MVHFNIQIQTMTTAIAITGAIFATLFATSIAFFPNVAIPKDALTSRAANRGHLITVLLAACCICASALEGSLKQNLILSFVGLASIIYLRQVHQDGSRWMQRRVRPFTVSIFLALAFVASHFFMQHVLFFAAMTGIALFQQLKRLHAIRAERDTHFEMLRGRILQGRTSTRDTLQPRQPQTLRLSRDNELKAS